MLSARADELSARLALAAEPPEPARALEYLQRAADCYTEGAADRDQLWRVLVLRARAQAAAGDALLSRRALREARQVLEALADAVPEVHQEEFWSDPDKAWVLERSEGRVPGDGQAQPGDSAHPGELGRYRRLATIAKRLNSELDTDRLLEQIVDSVIDLLGAERGFLLLLRDGDGDSGALDVAVARGIDLDGAAGTDGAVFPLYRRAGGAYRRAPGDGGCRQRRPLRCRSVGARVAPALGRSGPPAGSGVGLPVRCTWTIACAGGRSPRVMWTWCRTSPTSQPSPWRTPGSIGSTWSAANASPSSTRSCANGCAPRSRRSARYGRSSGFQRGALETRYDYSNIVGRAPAMRELFRLLDRVTATAVPVLLTGESGTGKELVAKAIHYNGPRSDRNFVSENCAAIPETLLESALFGHVRGAFTGADREKKGLFELAHTGTLFLDEIGEMTLGMQSKLLRVLQEGELRRVGGQKLVKVDVRIIAATNKDLRRMVSDGTFREDLYYRLAVLHVNVPPLRERREDVPLLVEHFMGRYAEGRSIDVDRRAMTALMNYPWPGNVRELENEVMRACVLAEEVLTVHELSPAVAAREQAPARVQGRAHAERRGRRPRAPSHRGRPAQDRWQPDPGGEGAGAVPLRIAEENQALRAGGIGSASGKGSVFWALAGLGYDLPGMARFEWKPWFGVAAALGSALLLASAAWGAGPEDDEPPPPTEEKTYVPPHRRGLRGHRRCAHPPGHRFGRAAPGGVLGRGSGLHPARTREPEGQARWDSDPGLGGLSDARRWIVPGVPGDHQPGDPRGEGNHRQQDRPGGR